MSWLPFYAERYIGMLFKAATANFWQARPPQWRPHQRRVASAAAIFYSAKSRQGLALGGLASRGVPAFIRWTLLRLCYIRFHFIRITRCGYQKNWTLNRYHRIFWFPVYNVKVFVKVVLDFMLACCSATPILIMESWGWFTWHNGVFLIITTRKQALRAWF